MTAELIGQTQPIAYDSRTGQYSRNGRFIPRAEVLREVDAEAARLKVRLQGHARLLASDRLSLPEFQTRVANDLKASHIRMGMLAAGGRDGMTQRHYGAIGRQLRDQYGYLEGFGIALANGELSARQAIDRAGRYGQSVRSAFFRSEKLTREIEGWNEAKRDLDPQANHCSSCIGFSTNGQWRSIDEVTPPAVNCQCHSNCRCRISYRKNRPQQATPLGAIASIANQIIAARDPLSLFGQRRRSGSVAGSGRGFG